MPKTSKNGKEKMKSDRCGNITALLIGVLGICLMSCGCYLTKAICHACNLITPILDDEISNGAYLGMLAISYSVIFLTTSLMGMLSDKSETIYWERVSEFILIYPKVFNYYNCSIIAYLSLGIETLAMILNANVVFWGSFITGIAAIVIVYFRVTSVYFDRCKYLRQLERILIKGNRFDYLYPDGFTQLCELTVNAASENNSRNTGENINLLMRLAYGDLGQLIKDRSVISDARRSIYYVLTQIFEINPALTERVIEENAGFFKHDIANETDSIDIPDSKHDLINWITDDVSRVSCWVKFSKTFSLSDCFDGFAQEYLPSGITDEDEDCKSIISHKDQQAIEYRPFLQKKIRFFIYNDLWMDFEKYLNSLLNLEYDPLEWDIFSTPIIPSQKSGFLGLILDTVYDDDYRFMNILMIMDIVFHNSKYDHWKNRSEWLYEKERALIRSVRNAYIYKEHYLADLETVYHEYMLKNCSGENRSVFLEDLMKQRDPKWIIKYIKELEINLDTEGISKEEFLGSINRIRESAGDLEDVKKYTDDFMAAR